MQFHYHTLQHLAKWLTEHFKGETLHTAFSQNKNELVLGFAEDKFLRIGCHTPLTYIVPVKAYSRARKNVVDLFPELLDRQIIAARVVDYDRVLIISFSGGWEMIAKMHSISSNVILRKKGKVVHLFNNQLENDWEFEENPGTTDQIAIDQEVAQEPAAIQKALRAISVVYDKVYVQRCLYWMEQGLTFREAFDNLLSETQQDDAYLYRDGNRVRFSLIPVTDADSTIRIEGVVAGLNMLLRTHFQLESYRTQYKVLDQAIRKPLLKKQKMLDSYHESIQQMESLRNPEEIGHILLACLHQIQPGQKKVTLKDLYAEDETDIEIALDPKLSPQENATKYYNKHKNRKHKLVHIRQQVEELEEDVLEGMEDLEAFDQLPVPESLLLGPNGWEGDAFQMIKPLSKKHRKEEIEAASKQLPFRMYKREGFEILVGKNARNNDELSFHFAAKNDLWLHAKDVTGSHVVIRHRAGKDLPPMVLEYAAQLAAFFSKRKQDTLVPVIYTPRKYIRKRKGDPPGLVAVDREQVIMVEPLRRGE